MLKRVETPWIVACVWIAVRRKFLGPIHGNKGNQG
jgi:hypothetical protein